MKHAHIRHFLTGTLLLLLSVCMVMTAWAEAPITFTDRNMVNVSFTFSKDSYALGTEIAVKYAVTGGSGNYTFLDYHSYSEDNGSSIYVYNRLSGPATSPSGTIYFTPTVGQRAYVEVSGVDSQGRHFEVKSKTVPLTGGAASTPITIALNFRKSSYAVGSTVTADYRVTGGSGSYPILQYQCYVIDGSTTATVKEEDVSSTSGTISFVPRFGQSAYVSFWVYDSQGRSFSRESNRVSLTGGPSNAVTGKVTIPKSSYKPGSLVTATYSISGGSGNYPMISYKCWGLEDDGAYVIYKEGDLASTSGTITFSPTIGVCACIDVFGYDSDDRHFSISSKTITIASLKKIGIKKITAVSAKKLKVEWKKLSAKDRKKIKYIEVQVSTDKNFSKIVKQKKVKSSKTSWTVSGLKKNTKYYVRIRAYAKSGNDVSISPWAVKNKKTKKK